MPNPIHAYDTGFITSDAETDFRRARRRHTWSRLLVRLPRGQRGNTLPTMDPDALGTTRGLGLQPIDINTIVGSVAHRADFDREFRPGRSVDARRWQRLSRATRSGEQIPPITVYRVDGRHFVHDGHHRISVARALGISVIDAYVTEVRTMAPTPPRDTHRGRVGSRARADRIGLDQTPSGRG
jgi:hypothetical protein